MAKKPTNGKLSLGHSPSAKQRGLRSPRLAAHHHTGKLLPINCTSYAALFFLLCATALTVLFAQHLASADAQTGSIQLTGVVKGQPPDLAPVVSSPINDQHLTQKITLVAGTCLEDTYIEVYRNGMFAGMTVCNTNGQFSVDISLVPGRNILSVRIRDALGQYGPDAQKVTVYYDVGLVGTSDHTNGIATPLVIYLEATQWGTNIDQELDLRYSVAGGFSPYTVSIDWDDDTPSSLINHETEGTFTAKHQFDNSGLLHVWLTVIDGSGDTSSVQTVVAVVGRGTNVVGSLADGICVVGKPGNNLRVKLSSDLSKLDLANCSTKQHEQTFADVALPVVGVATVMTASFWLGEQLIYHKIAALTSHRG